MLVKRCHLHHPPAIIIFIGGMVAIPTWVYVYDIVFLPTLINIGITSSLVIPGGVTMMAKGQLWKPLQDQS